MNAYQLAERLEDLQVEYTDDLVHEKCVNMLRQQADRIAELEKNFDALNAKHTKLVIQQSAKPVAWMDKRTNKCVVFINTPPSDDWIPLYTHPADLTDEELVILMNTAKILLQKFVDLTDENIAILKKAQE